MPLLRRSLAVLLLLGQAHAAAATAPLSRPKLNLDPPADLIPQGPRNNPAGQSPDQDQPLPEIGDFSGTVMTPLQEKELGSAFFRSLHNETQISEDPEIADYIQTIGQKLAENSANPSLPFHFFVVVEPTINAFAGPGGYIGVNSGLILTSESESELASVLSHEIAHVTQRHLYQAFQAANRLTLPTAAAMLAAILIGAKTGSSQAGQAAIIAAQAASTQYQINFTRDNEAEADRVGMQTLARSEYDPRSMPSFFEKLQQSTRYAGRNLPEFLLTHPVTVSRIADTRARSEQFPFRQYPDSLPYQLIRAKLRAQTSASPADAVNYFRAIANQGTRQQRDVAAYGLALALIADNKPADARPALQNLALQYPDFPQFLTALAHCESESGNRDKALQIYEMADERFPNNRAITLNYVRALLSRKRADSARKLLQQYSRHHPSTPEVYGLLAETYAGLNNPPESHRYLAEYYYASGQTRAAIQQLRIARRAGGDDYYVNAVIDERLRQFEQEEAERRKR
ncbi:MAG: M48 family metallopeptidase [Methylococcaceae bacterium]|nr:M48 family metallopeptidase [Methylococcaceae bacterium]